MTPPSSPAGVAPSSRTVPSAIDMDNATDNLTPDGLQKGPPAMAQRVDPIALDIVLSLPECLEHFVTDTLSQCIRILLDELCAELVDQLLVSARLETAGNADNRVIARLFFAGDLNAQISAALRTLGAKLADGSILGHTGSSSVEAGGESTGERRTPPCTFSLHDPIELVVQEDQPEAA